MADLMLSGLLNLGGNLELAASGGKVKAEGANVLVAVGRSGAQQGQGSPVMMPPSPAGPLDTGPAVRIIKSFNSGVTIHTVPVVALGITAQGNQVIWPGMVLPSTVNTKVKLNGVAINVEGDSAITLPNGGTVSLDTSGQ